MNLHDALGTQPFYPDDAARIGGQAMEAAECYESQGIPFLMMIVPNKEGVYREYMPDAYKRIQGENQPGQPEDYIRKHSDVAVSDPREYLNTNRGYMQYYKTNMHRNNTGGYAAGQVLIEALGGMPVPIKDMQVDCIKGAPGDLANLFHLPEKYCNSQITLISGYHEDPEAMVKDVDGDKNVVHTSTPGAPDKRRVAAIRDSFRTTLIDFLPKHLVNVGLYHWQVFDRSLLEENPPDAVVYLIVERDPIRVPQDVGKMVPEG